MIIGIFLKNYKVYDGIKFIPISTGEYFCAYFGANGIGKSSILEALDTYFNNRDWNPNKSVNAGGHGYINQPYIVPIFLIKKERFINIEKSREIIEKISNYVWSTNVVSTTSESKLFFDYRNELKKNFSEKDYFLLPVGIRQDNDKSPYFGIFQHNEEFLSLFNIAKGKSDNQTERTKEEDSNIESYFKNNFDILEYIRSQYNYLYIPSEVDVATYTQLETSDMQKLMHKNIRDEIEEAISKTKLDEINDHLQSYIDEVSKNLEFYTYEKPKAGKSKITMSDLVNRIIKAFFSIRVLTKTEPVKVPVTNLSSGEKRKALIDVAFAFLNTSYSQEKNIILAIDEPELSLHISSCYDQFEKLRIISSKNHQVLITTHWYGFLPVVGNGDAHNIVFNDEKRVVTSYSLEKYQEEITINKRHMQGELPIDVYLKGKYDLIQSIISSLRADMPYNFLFVEGSSDKIYMMGYLKYYCEKETLRIIPLGGCGEVISLMRHLYIATDNKDDVFKGKVLGLIDTDEKYMNIKDYQDTKNLSLKRFRYDKNIDDIVLENFNSQNSVPVTEIEDVLEPEIFVQTLQEIVKNGNSINYDFLSNKNTNAKCSYNCIDYTETQRCRIRNFFSENGQKVKFAKEYIKNTLSPDKIKCIQDICNYFGYDCKKLRTQEIIQSANKTVSSSSGISKNSKRKIIVIKRK